MKSVFKWPVLLLVVALCLVLLPVAAAGGDGGTGVIRLEGPARWHTSVEVAKDAISEGQVTGDTVIIARGDDAGGWADGLAASFLAGVTDAPILLTLQDELPGVVEDYLKDLAPSKAYILGGEAAVTPAVKTAVEDTGDLEVKRIEGATRYKTAVEIAEHAAAEYGATFDTAFVVQGHAPPDSMAAGAMAFSEQAPILLVAEDSLPAETASLIEDKGIETIYIVGGTAVVSANVKEELKALAGVESVTRLSGKDRIETGLVLAEDQFSAPDGFSIVNGWDGLADAVGAAVYGNPILYTRTFGEELPGGVHGYLEEELTGDALLRLFGGHGVIRVDLAWDLWDIIEGPDRPDFRVYRNRIWAENWEPDTEVTITINKVEYHDVTDGEGHFHFHFDDAISFEAGDEVTVTDNVTTMTHQVKQLKVTRVDQEKDLIEGVAEPGRFVSVHIDKEVNGEREFSPPIKVRSDINGEWSADFAGKFDIDEDCTIFAYLFDDRGNSTGYDWRFPDPQFVVNPRRDELSGYGWSPDQEITVTVYDNGSAVHSAVVQSNEHGYIDYGFRLDFDLEIGQQVTLEDPVSGLVRSHEIAFLRITGVDYDNDLVIGEADPNTEVMVHIWLGPDHDEHPEIRITADADGDWKADFSGIHDLQPGDNIDPHVFDEQGNATFVQWREEYGPIWVNLAKNEVSSRGWALDEPVTITIDDGEEIQEFNTETDTWGDFTYTLDDFDLQAGDEVTVDDGVVSEAYEILPLEVEVSKEDDTVSGSTAPESDVRVFAFDTFPGSYLFTEARPDTSDNEGNWEVDFSTAEGDQAVYDINSDSYIQIDVECGDSEHMTYFEWPEDQ